MRWKCISVAFSLREPSKASAIRLRALACSARIASYSGTMRPKAAATFSATPSWGQSWRAISKVRAWRVSRLGEDLERLEAIWRTFFLAPGAAGPSPARSPRCGTKKPGPGGLHPKGRSACGGRRRAANLSREEFGVAEGEIRRPQSLLAERVGLKAAHNRGEWSWRWLLLRPVVGARKKDLRNG